MSRPSASVCQPPLDSLNMRQPLIPVPIFQPMSDSDTQAVRYVNCPICKQAAEFSPANPYRPFCSRRCKLIDLGQWANEQYKIAGSDKPTGPEPDADQ